MSCAPHLRRHVQQAVVERPELLRQVVTHPRVLHRLSDREPATTSRRMLDCARDCSVTTAEVHGERYEASRRATSNVNPCVAQSRSDIAKRRTKGGICTQCRSSA